MGTDPAATLPADFSSRPLTVGDSGAVFDVMAALEEAELGAAEIEEADIVSDWQRPSFDIATNTMGVFKGERLVGYGEYGGGDRSDAAVHPDFHGLGIGSWIARWIQDTARAAGQSVVGMPVPAGGSGDRLLEALGYRRRWTTWSLVLPAAASIPPRELPPGYRIDQADPDRLPDVHRLIENSFTEWADREPRSFADFVAKTVDRPGFAPWMIRVVTNPSGQVVSAAVLVMAQLDVVEAYVEAVATEPAERGRGLAQALLADCFATARTHGAQRSALSTDTRTGALGLYEKLGMQVATSWVNRAIDL